MRFLFTLLAPALAIAVSAPVLADNAGSPFCKRDLSPVSNTLSQTRTALNVLAKMTGEERCEAYRRQLFPVVAARDVLAACNSSFDRKKEVTQFDQVIEEVNSGTPTVANDATAGWHSMASWCCNNARQLTATA